MDQIPIANWPANLDWTVAVLQQEPNDLTKMLGIIFEESCDDLDYFQAAVLKTQSGNHIALIRYKGAPSGGTDLQISTESLEPESDLNEALRSLNLDRSSATWIAPNLSERWIILRQDDNGNIYQVKVYALESAARWFCYQKNEGMHKQHYWYEKKE